MDVDRAAVRLSDLPHDREPESAAAARTRAPVVGAPEAVEDPLAVLGRDPGAVVRDGKPGPAVDLPVREPDARPLGRHAHGVVEQVRDRPLEHVAVALHDPAGDDCRLELDRARGCGRGELLARVLEQGGQRDRLPAGSRRTAAQGVTRKAAASENSIAADAPTGIGRM